MVSVWTETLTSFQALYSRFHLNEQLVDQPIDLVFHSGKACVSLSRAQRVPTSKMVCGREVAVEGHRTVLLWQFAAGDFQGRFQKSPTKIEAQKSMISE